MVQCYFPSFKTRTWNGAAVYFNDSSSSSSFILLSKNELLQYQRENTSQQAKGSKLRREYLNRYGIPSIAIMVVLHQGEDEKTRKQMTTML